MRTFDQGKALAQTTGLNSTVCGETVAPGQVESVSPFSAVPAITPKSLISSATPLLPSGPRCFAVSGVPSWFRFAKETARRCCRYG